MNNLALIRECVRTGAEGAQTRRSLGHHLLHPLILRLLVLYVHPLILRPRALFYRTDCTRRSKFLTHALLINVAMTKKFLITKFNCKKIFPNQGLEPKRCNHSRRTNNLKMNRFWIKFYIGLISSNTQKIF